MPASGPILSIPRPTCGSARKQADPQDAGTANQRFGAIAELTTVHSLGWLVAANLVGLWLATLLLFPALGRLTGPLTYGRWMPVHMDLHLYGWVSLPMVGVLLRLFQPPTGGRVLPRLAIAIWSGTLLFGAVSWLTGNSSGKLFLEWTGTARFLWLLSLGFLAMTLWIGFLRQLAARSRDLEDSRPGRWTWIAKAALLLTLSAVPFVLYAAANPEIYPPINPQSGGPTGGSLMGSALGLVAIIFAYPYLLGLRANDGGRAARWTAAGLGGHFAWFLALDHGNHSHLEWLQIVSLASVALWWPLLVQHLRRFEISGVGRVWLVAFALWGAFLIATGVIAFLPTVLEGVKFTHVLVAHAHVAMAGMVTCFDVLILEGLHRGTRLAGLFRDHLAWLLWHGGTVLLVMALITLGVLEAMTPDFLFNEQTTVSLLYALRWIGGAAMFAASWRWLVLATRSTQSSGAVVRRPATAEARHVMRAAA